MHRLCMWSYIGFARTFCSNTWNTFERPDNVQTPGTCSKEWSRRRAPPCCSSMFLVFEQNVLGARTHVGCSKMCWVSEAWSVFKYTDLPKLPKIQKLQKIQNMSYPIYTNNKIKIGLFDFFRIFDFSNVPKVLWHCWSILYNKSLFWISYSDSVYVTLYGNIDQMYIWTFFLTISKNNPKMSQKCEQFPYWPN